MLPDDYPKHLQFCNDIVVNLEQDVLFAEKIVFSNEATFYLNGSVNLHNAFIYSANNPHANTKKKMKSPSITCWAMLLPKFGI